MNANTSPETKPAVIDTNAPSNAAVSLITKAESTTIGVPAWRVTVPPDVSILSGSTWMVNVSLFVPPFKSSIVMVTVELPKTPGKVV